MEADFWHRKWADNVIGFHLDNVNPKLVKYLPELNLKKGERIFLPLCGKTLDIAWLLGKGFYVIGSELSELAIKQLFDELEVNPLIRQQENLKLYKAENLEIYVGDIFDLNTSMLKEVDAVYDRAALVALPEGMRIGYTKHLSELTNKARQLLITFEYNQTELPGPPFSVSNEEVRKHYSTIYNLNLLGTFKVPGGLKGKCDAEENIWSIEQI